jgi:hypothetical protein
MRDLSGTRVLIRLCCRCLRKYCARILQRGNELGIAFTLFGEQHVVQL